MLKRINGTDLAPDGVQTCLFRFVSPGGDVPGILWTPAGRQAPPVVLLGHGGSGSKGDARIDRLARWFASSKGLAAIAVDGPYHGDRLSESLSTTAYQQRMIEDGIKMVATRMVQDWLGVLSALADTGDVDATRVAYLGMSMGTRFGIPLAAALGPQLRCAVFGKFGLSQSFEMHPGLTPMSHIVEAARQITAPVLMHVQWDDELFPREGQLELFSTFASAKKALVASPGGHRCHRLSDESTWREFVAGPLKKAAATG